MARGNTDLTSYEYDNHLAQFAKHSRTARQEIEQRKVERKNAHDSSGVGYHFGLSDQVIKVESKEHFKKILDQNGLMLATDVKKDLKIGRRR